MEAWGPHFERYATTVLAMRGARPSVCVSARRSVRLSIAQSVARSTRPSIRLSVRPFVCLLQPSFQLSVRSSFRLSAPPVRPSVRQYVRPPFRLFHRVPSCVAAHLVVLGSCCSYICLSVGRPIPYVCGAACGNLKPEACTLSWRPLLQGMSPQTSSGACKTGSCQRRRRAWWCSWSGCWTSKRPGLAGIRRPQRLRIGKFWP
jgi:hypothetical protein